VPQLLDLPEDELRAILAATERAAGPDSASARAIRKALDLKLSQRPASADTTRAAGMAPAPRVAVGSGRRGARKT